MTVNGLGADAEAIGDSGIGKSPRDGLQDLDLAPRKAAAGIGSGENDTGPTRDDPPSGDDLGQPLTQFFDRRGFEENAIHTIVDELPENSRRRTARNNDHAGLRAPAAGLDQHFQTRCTGHDQIEYGTIRLVPLDRGDGLDAVGDTVDNLKTEHGFDCCTRSEPGQGVILGNQYGNGHRIRPAEIVKRCITLPGRLLALLLAIMVHAVAAQADERILDLQGPVSPDRVGDFTDFFIDEGRDLELANIIALNENSFEPIKTQVPDFGYTDATIWLRLRVQNRTDETSDWRLYFQENFKQIFHVFVVRPDASVEHPLAQSIDSPFTTRPIADPEVVVPLTLAPQQRATILVQYWTEGSTNLPLSIETAETYAGIAAKKAAKNFVFYGMMLIMITIALLALFVFRQAIFAAYTAYAGCTLLYLMHSDGVAFQYLWPAFPLFNSFASVVTGAGYIIFGAIFARMFLNTARENPVIDRVLLALIGVAALMVLSTVVIPTTIIKKYLILVALISVLTYAVAGLVVARRRFRQVRFYVVAWLGAALSAGLMAVRHWLGVEVSQEFQYDSMRVVMVFDALMMGMAIFDRYSQLRIEHQKALQASLDVAQRNLAMSKRLRDLETRYQLAVRTSARRDRMIENTIHDLRQPLHALRLAVHDIARSGSGSSKNHASIGQSFDYLEKLVSDHLENTGASADDPESCTGAQDTTDMSLDEVLASIREMFLPDAREKGLSLTYVPTSQRGPVKPLVIMRIVTNLVANAIKYTQSGKVLMGVRCRGDKLGIEVHDTGAGLTSTDFEDACRRAVRLEQADREAVGNGFGLAIVIELAERHGYRVYHVEGRNNGTGIGVEVPLMGT